MRLTTANLWNGRADVASLRRVLEDTGPDVLICQEVGFDAAEVIASMFPHGTVRGGDDCDGRAFVSVFPIDVKQVEVVHRPLQVADVDGVLVVGAHLANPVQRRVRFGRGVEVDAIRSLTDGVDRVVVAGDLNSTPVWPAYRRLTRDLDDAVAGWSRSEGSRPKQTWSRVTWGPRLLRIDHVLTRGLRATSVRWDRVTGSDHLAVTVDLETS